MLDASNRLPQAAIDEAYTSASVTAAQDVRMAQGSWRQAELPHRLVLRLATLVVILGLLNIPVECVVAAGPHSLFLASETVVTLRRSSHEAFARHEGDAEGTGTPSARVHGSPASHQQPSMPTPAGFASRAVPSGVIAGPLAGPRLLGAIPHVSTRVAPLLEHDAVGPEPPPPNLDQCELGQ